MLDEAPQPTTADAESFGASKPEPAQPQPSPKTMAQQEKK